jgi:hypothetical protein
VCATVTSVPASAGSNVTTTVSSTTASGSPSSSQVQVKASRRGRSTAVPGLNARLREELLRLVEVLGHILESMGALDRILDVAHALIGEVHQQDISLHVDAPWESS